MRRPPLENVLHLVDVEAADAEPCPVTRRLTGAVAPNEDVGALENTCLPHRDLGGRPHLLGRRAVDLDLPREPPLFHELLERDRSREADWTLRVVLAAVERLLRAAERVVFDDDA